MRSKEDTLCPTQVPLQISAGSAEGAHGVEDCEDHHTDVGEDRHAHRGEPEGGEEEDAELHDRLMDNVAYFQEKIKKLGFDLLPTQSAIVAVMIYDAAKAAEFAARMQEEGIFVTGFSYPVVSKDKARIRVQLSAAHTHEQIDRCIAAFDKIGHDLGILK